MFAGVASSRTRENFKSRACGPPPQALSAFLEEKQHNIANPNN